MNAGSDWPRSRALRLNRLEQSLEGLRGVKKGSQEGVTNRSTFRFRFLNTEQFGTLVRTL